MCIRDRCCTTDKQFCCPQCLWMSFNFAAEEFGVVNTALSWSQEKDFFCGIRCWDTFWLSVLSRIVNERDGWMTQWASSSLPSLIWSSESGKLPTLVSSLRCALIFLEQGTVINSYCKLLFNDNTNLDGTVFLNISTFRFRK